MKLTLTEIADTVGGKVGNADRDIVITGIASLADATAGDLTFFGNPKYIHALKKAKATAALVPLDFDTKIPARKIHVENPSAAFAKIGTKFAPAPVTYTPGVHSDAFVSPEAVIGEGASIQPGAVISRGAKIGARTVIDGNAFIGEEAEIGEDCVIHPNVTIRERCKIADRVSVHAGTVVGSDGYGYELVDGKHTKIPQVGIVQIESDVEIGSNCAIDRARFGKTLIGEGTKIDNLVQIGHNTVIGKHCLLVSQVGISGSAKLGDYVIVAGQAGVAGHIEVGDRVVVAGQSGVTKDTKADSKVFGMPAIPIREYHRKNVLNAKIPSMLERIDELEEKLKQLESDQKKQ